MTSGGNVRYSSPPIVISTETPETPAEAKARMDVANQVAIDVVRTATAEAKAKADAANQAAIDAARAAAAANSKK